MQTLKYFIICRLQVSSRKVRDLFILFYCFVLNFLLPGYVGKVLAVLPTDMQSTYTYTVRIEVTSYMKKNMYYRNEHIAYAS